MSKFMEVYDGTPVQEGWGALLTRFIPQLYGARIIQKQISNDFLRETLKGSDVKKYIKDTCDKILKNEKKQDKSVTKKMPSGVTAAISRWWHSDDTVSLFTWSRLANFRNTYEDDLIYNFDVDGFNITFFYDTDHIDAAVVVLYSEEKDQVFGRRIPAPDKADLAKYFHKE